MARKGRDSLSENRISADFSPYMEKTFRDILLSHMENNERPSTAPSGGNSSGTSPLETLFFEFSRPANASSFAATPYRTFTPPKRPRPKAASQPTKPEVAIPLEKLPARELSCVKKMVALGAENLTQELRMSWLKREHRRLAKRYHPDRQRQEASLESLKAASQSFIDLTDAYGILFDYLTAKTAA